MMKRILQIAVASLVLTVAVRAGIMATILPVSGLKDKQVMAQLIVDYALFGVIPSTYDAQLKQEVTEDEYNYQVVLLCKYADDNDTVNIHINSPGGSAVAMIAIVNAIDASRAYTVSINECMAASAAAIISMATDEAKGEPLSFYLFHQGRYGDTHELIERDDPIAMMVNNFVYARVFPLLTEEQKATYEQGGDVILDGPTWANAVENARSVK